MSDTSAAGISALAGSLLGLSVIFTGMRFYTRKHTKAPLLADDWLMILAVIGYIGACASVFYGVHLKVFGYSSFQFTEEQIAATEKQGFQLELAIDVFTILSLGCTKASALFFYRRIFCVLGPRTRVFSGIVIGSLIVVACWVVTFELLAGFQCHTHFNSIWDGNQLKECTISYPFLYGMVISDVLLDVWVLALPIPLVLRLNTSIQKKISIVGVFALAFVALGASLARMVIFIRLYLIGAIEYTKLNPEELTTQFAFYYILEVGISIIAINMPSNWPMFSKFGPEAVVRMARSLTSLGSGGVSEGSKWNQPSKQAHSHTVDSNRSLTSTARNGRPYDLELDDHNLSDGKDKRSQDHEEV